MGYTLAFLRLPFWVFFLIAAGLFLLEGNEARTGAATAERLEIALASPAPAPVDLSPAVTVAKASLNEVILRAQIDMSQTTELVEQVNGVVQDRDIMFALAAPDAQATPQSFRAFVVVPKESSDRFTAWATERVVGEGPLGPIVELDGTLSGTRSEASHIKDVLEERGLARGADDIYLSPFYEGREAAFARRLERAVSTGGVFALLAKAMLALGAIKLGLRVLRMYASGQVASLAAAFRGR